jgi:hypothetical protein
MLQRRHQPSAPCWHGQTPERWILQARRCADGKKHHACRDRSALAAREVGIFDDRTIAVTSDGPEQRTSPNFGAFAGRKVCHRSVQLFTRAGMPGSEEQLVLGAVTVK